MTTTCVGAQRTFMYNGANSNSRVVDSKHSISVVAGLVCAFTLCSSGGAYAATPPDPCSLLTQAQVSGVFGINMEAAQRIAPRLCQWSAPNQPNSMNAKKVALVIIDERAFGAAEAPPMRGIKTMPASGVCDDAVYTVTPGVTPGLGTDLYVKKGNSFSTVHVYGFSDQAKVMAMEKTLAVEACSKL